MMAQQVPHPLTDKKRVKVYELRNNDWFDRGTGFCSAAFAASEDGENREARVTVESEDHPDRLLLQTKICKEDGFQKQQETLIVWTEPSNGVDMALSFQEPEGCAMIWKFVNGVQQSLQSPLNGPDDSLSDDLAMDMPTAIQLPAAELGSLPEIEHTVRLMGSNASGRGILAKAIMAEDYISKLIPLVDIAEDLESLPDLHRLCNIMKTILLLNDTGIIEHAVSDDCVIGVVGALEYDPDFPSHKANHRMWLNGQGRYKEVVRIENDQVRRKIHQTYRLQYLRDVVLARILDDPTYSVLNSLIFFNQVDIVQHLQENAGFLRDLFGIFDDPSEGPLRKKEAVLFIQQCTAIAKNLQVPARQNLYLNFLRHGLLQVINFGLRNADVSARVGATDVLISMLDHDPQMLRNTIYRQLQESQPPLTDTLIDILLVERDLGIKSQVSEALKVLLDPNSHAPVAAENFGKAGGEFQARSRPQVSVEPQQEFFIDHFYDHSADRLFKPLLDLEKRTEMQFDARDDGAFSYLNDILCFFVRQHHRHSKYFVLQRNLVQRFIQLLGCNQTHLQLVALRFFQQLIALQDDFYAKHMVEKQIFGPVLDILLRIMPRDNLLCSACLDLFELIKKENIKDLVKHLVENYREKMAAIAYIDTFRDILNKYDQAQGFTGNVDAYLLDPEEDVGRRPSSNPNARGMMEHLAVDPVQEEYWNTSDDEDEMGGARGHDNFANGGSDATKPLVEYGSSDEDTEDNGGDGDGAGRTAGSGDEDSNEEGDSPVWSAGFAAAATPPPERVSEKRRREQDEDDEMDRLMQHKRRNSSAASINSANVATALRKKASFAAGGSRDPSPNVSGPKRISISISPTLRNSAENAPPTDGGTA